MSAPGASPPSRRPRHALALGLAATITLATCDGWTAPPASPESAEQHALDLFKRSKAAYDSGDFKEAIDLLLQAYAVEPKPVILFNLARAYEGLGELEKAVDAYTGYLGKEPNSTDRGAIETRVATLERQLAERAALEKQRDERLTADAERRPRLDASTGAATQRRPSVVPWIVGGVGVLTLGVGAGFGVAAGQLHQSAVADGDAGSALSKQSEAQSAATAANVLFIVGGSLALAGLTWGLIDLATHSPRSPGRDASMAVGPGSVTVVGSF